MNEMFCILFLIKDGALGDKKHIEVSVIEGIIM